jgi:hypothetical protein
MYTWANPARRTEWSKGGGGGGGGGGGNCPRILKTIEHSGKCITNISNSGNSFIK